jgi:toxin ParE1/3/4
MQLSFTPLAEQDLESIAEFIAVDSPARALSFIRKLRKECNRITLSPLACRARPELSERSNKTIRSLAYGNYVIFFMIDGDEVAIVRVLHGARDIPSVFGVVQ